MKKLLTIVVPTYNTEKYLSRCIDSLIVPEFMDCLEILIVNDGSLDGSLALAYQYEKLYPLTVSVINKKNGGHGSTINVGIERAQGKYFRVLDSDDWFDTAEFKAYLNELSSMDVDMVLGHSTRELVYENCSQPLEYKGIEFGKIYTADRFDYSNFPADKFIILANVTYLTEVLRRSNLKLYEKCFYVDVQYSSFVFLKVKTFTFSSHNVYRYFIGRPEQSVSVNGFRKNFEHHRRVMLSCAQYLMDNNLTNSQLANVKWLYDSLMEKCCRQYVMAARYMKFLDAVKESQLYSKALQNISPQIYNQISKYSFGIRLIRINMWLGIIAIKLRSKIS